MTFSRAHSIPSQYCNGSTVAYFPPVLIYIKIKSPSAAAASFARVPFPMHSSRFPGNRYRVSIRKLRIMNKKHQLSLCSGSLPEETEQILMTTPTTTAIIMTTLDSRSLIDFFPRFCYLFIFFLRRSALWKDIIYFTIATSESDP